MPYFPTFAFFEGGPQIRKVAQILVRELGEELCEISFKIYDSFKNETVVFESKELALLFLKHTDINIVRFWLASDLHTLEFELLPKGYLSIKFWDFAPEIYDTDGPTEEMKNAKRLLALILHTALVKSCEASFSYTSSADDKYSGFNDHFETAEMVCEAMRQNKFFTISRILKTPLYFWLAGLKKATRLAEALEVQLKEDFHEAYVEINSVIFEHKENRPFFLL